MLEKGSNMEQNDVTVFQQSLMACGDPVEITRKVRLAFKKMPVRWHLLASQR